MCAHGARTTTIRGRYTLDGAEANSWSWRLVFHRIPDTWQLLVCWRIFSVCRKSIAEAAVFTSLSTTDTVLRTLPPFDGCCRRFRRAKKERLFRGYNVVVVVVGFFFFGRRSNLQGSLWHKKMAAARSRDQLIQVFEVLYLTLLKISNLTTRRIWQVLIGSLGIWDAFGQVR